MHAVLERVVGQIASELRSLDAETTQLHPNGLDYKWSAQQVVEHLVLGYRLTSSALETRLNKGRLSRNQKRTYLQWSLQLMILSFGALPRGVPALDETMPVCRAFCGHGRAATGRSFAPGNRRHGHAVRSLPAQIRHRAGSRASLARTAARGSVAPLPRGAWIAPPDQLRSVIAQVAPLPVPVRLASPN